MSAHANSAFFASNHFQSNHHGRTASIFVAAGEGGTVRPFKRVAVTPEVLAEIYAKWDIIPPAIVIPSDPALRPIYPEPIVVQPDRFAGTNVTELTKGVVLALPQFSLLTSSETLPPLTGATVDEVSAHINASSSLVDPMAGSETAPVNAASMAFRTGMIPTTIRNPTDEELVAIVLGLI